MILNQIEKGEIKGREAAEVLGVTIFSPISLLDFFFPSILYSITLLTCSQRFMGVSRVFETGPTIIKTDKYRGHTGFPDYSMTVVDMIAEGDKVFILSTRRGTNSGEFISGFSLQENT
jgi:hypothetical protein